MAFRRYRRRTFKRRSRKRPTGSGAMAVARAAIRGVSFLKSVLNPEKKFIDVTASPTVNSSGSFSYLSAIAQGDDVSSRNGNSVKASSLLLRWTLQWNTASANPVRVRIIVLRDKENQGGTPTTTDLLQGAGSTLAPMEMTNQSGARWMIYSDKTYNLSDQVPSLAPKMYVKFKNVHFKYGGTTAAVGDARENALFAFIITDAGVNNPTATFYSRIKYYDN